MAAFRRVPLVVLLVLAACGDTDDSTGDGSGDVDFGGDDDVSADSGPADSTANDATSEDVGVVDVSGADGATADATPVPAVGLVGECQLGGGAGRLWLVGQSPTQLHGISLSDCSVWSSPSTFEEPPSDLEVTDAAVFFATPRRVVAIETLGLTVTAVVERADTRIAVTGSSLLATSPTTSLERLDTDLNVAQTAPNTERLIVQGCNAVQTDGEAAYAVCAYTINGNPYTGVLNFASIGAAPTVTFTNYPDRGIIGTALDSGWLYALEVTQPTLHQMAAAGGGGDFDLLPDFPPTDFSVSTLSGRIYGVAGDLWLTTLGDMRGQIYAFSVGEFVNFTSASNTSGVQDAFDMTVRPVTRTVWAIAPYSGITPDGQPVSGTEIVAINANTFEVVGRTVINGIVPGLIAWAP